MGKPRVIIADLDESYLSPLEMKFLEELGDAINMEVISEKEYFDSLFSKPQAAEMLIISEELYTPDITRHNINDVFILTEIPETENIKAPLSKRIYKYSSLKEIYARIMAVSEISKKLDEVKPKETVVVLVCSAAGGTGKTTISLGISSCMEQNFNRVLFLSAEHMNTFQYRLGNTITIPSGVCAGGSINQNLYYSLKPYIRKEGFDYVPPFNASLSSLNIPFSIYERFITAAKESKEYDIIVVDTDTVFDEEKARLAAISDKVFIITGQDKASVFATNILLKNMSCKDTEKFYYICNDLKSDERNVIFDEEIEKDFVVDEYVTHFIDIDYMDISELGKMTDIQKISFLVI